MKKILFFIIALSSMLPFSKAGATDYYVRPAGTTYGSGNGTSYANAWSGFSNINWTTVDNGNGILWVDGVNTEPMTVGASGEAGTPIHVKGNSGSAFIQGIFISHRSYVKIENITVSGTNSGPGIMIENSDTNNIIVTGCILEQNYAAGVSIWDTGVNITVDNNIIRNNGQGTYHSDGIFHYSTAGGHVFSNNTIYNNGMNDNDGARDKSHGIYVGSGSASPIDIFINTIYGNTNGDGITLKSGANVYNNKIFSNHKGGLTLCQNTTNLVANIHNNIFYNNGDQAIGIYSLGGYTSNINIYNNSTYKNGTNGTGSWFTELLISNSITALNIKNNIFYANVENYTVSFGAAQSGMTADYNIHYDSSGNPIYYNGAGRSWSYWRTTLGKDPNGYNADPKYNNPPSDMTLQSSSPGISINAGASASGGAPAPANLIPSAPIIRGVY